MVNPSLIVAILITMIEVINTDGFLSSTCLYVYGVYMSVFMFVGVLHVFAGGCAYVIHVNVEF